jgi:hypothetical protein
MKKLISINREKVQETLDDARLGVEECEPNDSLIYQGWVEALEFVLHNEEK